MVCPYDFYKTPFSLYLSIKMVTAVQKFKQRERERAQRERESKRERERAMRERESEICGE